MCYLITSNNDCTGALCIVTHEPRLKPNLSLHRLFNRLAGSPQAERDSESCLFMRAAGVYRFTFIYLFLYDVRTILDLCDAYANFLNVYE